MTKRHFYNDSLAAEWMEKHFDMRYEGLADPIYWHEDAIPAKIYIHPASLRLLEPQVDDICMCRIHLDDPTSDIAPFRIHGPDTKHDVVSIIQRNSIAFMWPACEPQ